MSTYAFRDISRDESCLLYARDAVNEDRSVRFYCPNPKCDAKLFIRAINGVEKFCFSATGADPHVDGCDYSSVGGTRAKDYKEEGFSFDNAMNRLFNSSYKQTRTKESSGHPSGESEKKNPTTLRQIFLLCKDLYCTEEFNGIKAGQMLVDYRSEYMYPKGVFGNRIIELKALSGKFYDPKKKEIYLEIFAGTGKYSFLLMFQEDVYFTEIKNSIYNNRDRNIVVAGYWEKSKDYNRFQTIISSKRQVYLK